MTAAEGKNGIIGHDVFISYSNEKGESTQSDRQVAEMICAALESQDIRCWMAPRNILPGDDWLDKMIDAVIQSRLMILVFSAKTNLSSMVALEITRGLRENKVIIPFRIEKAAPLKGFRALEDRCHWMDAYTPPLEIHVQNLVEVVCKRLGEATKPVEKEKSEKPPGIKIPPDMPEDVKKVIPIADKVEKNEKGCWEAYYQDGIVMVYIPPGEFTMGQTEEEKKWLINNVGEKDYNSWYKRETPLHHVYLDGYWLGKYEVTFEQYDQYCEETKNKKPRDRRWGRGKHPVIKISWDDAKAYCQWLSQKIGFNFNLPTEAQWEKAARGSDSRKYPWGSEEPNKDLANFEENIGKTIPVGSYPEGASPYGLLDMAGNVWEWCSDWYSSDYYKNSPPKNPPGPGSGTYRVIRGGGWGDYARDLRCANRGSDAPSYRGYNLGFRLCQDI